MEDLKKPDNFLRNLLEKNTQMVNNFQRDQKLHKEKKEKIKPDINKKEITITKKEYEYKLILLLVKQERLYQKLDDLKPNNKNYIKKKSTYISKIRNIDSSIKEIEKSSGIKIENLDNRSKIKKIYIKIKHKLSSVWKHIRKYFKQNKKTILSILTIVIPIIGNLFLNKNNTQPIQS